MNDFVFYSPTEYVFGRGYTDKVGERVAARGFSRVLIVYGRGSVVRTGVLDRVKASLDAAGVEHDDCEGVRPNPEVGFVRAGIQQARAFGADGVLAVGGGSAIDAAKAIAFGVPYDGDVWDFFEKRATIAECLPVACVLTIPGAGSEGSSSCVISNDDLGLKTGTNSDLFRPKVAVLDPELTFTLPPYQTAAGITDMIAHICERYFSGVAAVLVTDNIACGLIRAIIDSAEVLLRDPNDYDARANVMWAATLAHNDIAGCGRSASPAARAGGWESHGLEHELSAHDPNVVHGAGLAVIMPAWMRYVWREDPSRFLSFAREVFGIEAVDESDEAVTDAVEAAIDELQRFFAGLGMPTKMGELGFSVEDVDALLPTLKANKGEVFGGFKKITLEDARAIYLSAF